ELNFYLLSPESRVSGLEHNFACLFLCANPNRSGSPNQRERIVANDLGWAFQFEFDGVVGEWTDGTELVGDAQHNAGGVGAVGDKLRIVGKQQEFCIDALS